MGNRNLPNEIVGMLATKLLTGGELTINGGDPTLFDVAAGTGTVIDSATNPPTLINVTWSSSNGLTPIASDSVTAVYIDNTGSIVQTAGVDINDADDNILIGVTVSVSGTIIFISDTTRIVDNPMKTFGTAIQNLGSIRKSGLDITLNSDLTVDTALGIIYNPIFSNSPTESDSTRPHLRSIIAGSSIELSNVYENTSGDLILDSTTLTPNTYNLNGVATSVPTDSFTIMRLFLNSVGPTNSPQIFAYYGNDTYLTIENALQGVSFELFTENNTTFGDVFMGWILIKESASSLNNTDDVRFVKFATGYGLRANINPGEAEVAKAMNDAVNATAQTGMFNGGELLVNSTDISTIQGDGGGAPNTVTVETTVPHGYLGSEVITIAGTSAYDEVGVTISVINTTTNFDYTTTSHTASGLESTGKVSDPTLFDISAGDGQVVNREIPTAVVNTPVTFTGSKALVDSFPGSFETFVLLNSVGNVIQQSTPITFEERRTLIALGRYIKLPSGVLAEPTPVVAYGSGELLNDLLEGLGGIKLTGLEISPNGANLKLDRNAGESINPGASLQLTPNAPSTLGSTITSPVLVGNFFKAYSNVGGSLIVDASTNDIDPNNYSPNSSDLLTIPTGRWSAQKVMYFEFNNDMIIYYGTEIYKTIDDAVLGHSNENFTEDIATIDGAFLGTLIVKVGTTDLAASFAAGEASFITSGPIREGVFNGGANIRTPPLHSRINSTSYTGMLFGGNITRDSSTITNIIGNGAVPNIVTVTIAAGHNYIATDVINIEGTTNYDETGLTVIAPVTSTTFTYSTSSHTETGSETGTAHDPSKFDIASGEGIIIDRSDPEIPVINTILITETLGVVDAFPGAIRTFILIDDTSSIIQQNTLPTAIQRRNNISLGLLVKIASGSDDIIVGLTNPSTGYGLEESINDIITSFGAINQSGNEYTVPNGDLTIDVTAGEITAVGQGYDLNPEAPNLTEQIGGTLTATFGSLGMQLTYTNGSGNRVDVISSVIDPNNHIDLSTDTLVATTAGRYTIQRIFRFGDTGQTVVWYGGVEYSNMATAQNSILIEKTQDLSGVNESAFRAWFIVQEGTTDLTSALAAGKAAIITNGPLRPQITGGAIVEETIFAQMSDNTDQLIAVVNTAQRVTFDTNDGLSSIGISHSITTRTFDILFDIAGSYIITPQPQIEKNGGGAGNQKFHLWLRLGTNDNGSITSVTSASPPECTTSAPHGLTTGQIVDLEGFTTAPDDINGEQTITVTGASTFTLDGADTTTSVTDGVGTYTRLLDINDDVANSNIEVTSDANAFATVAALIMTLFIEEGEKINIMISGTQTSFSLETTAPSGEPVIPSIIISINKTGV